ncbi:hypothetical protein SLEP1_g48353 [Rubroshorea leprosula]|uniref:F-box domain-containing protein n=1 Tax=Rubroshorea leprosula TaxID=152421 RepID=A0AAV5LVA9_9ROSI|nr:hypothetical protein SLEP1_g48353 [Rubroshorea leprosula]
MDKKYTKKTKWHEETQVDRLSDLPDSLIHHILSFMDAKYAVQTCILSKRWVSICTHLQVIKLDSKFFKRLVNFRSFMSQVLDHCQTSNVLAVSICMRKSTLEQSLFDKIVSFAVSHSVQELDLSLHSSEGVLKSAFRVVLDSENHCFDLFSSCLDLQNLVLDGVFLIFSDIFNISAPALVNLTMSKISFCIRKDAKNPDYASIEKRKVVITAPRLASFSFTCHRPLLLSMDNSPLLENVNLNMRHSEILDPREDSWFRFLIDMLRQLGNARSVTLSLDLVKFLSKHSRLLKAQPSPFINLESLKVVRGKQNCKALPSEVKELLALWLSNGRGTSCKTSKGK